MIRKLRFLAAAGWLALAAAGTSVAGADEYWPGESWRTSTPEAQGFSSAELAKAFDFVAQKDVNIHSLLILRHGYLLLEAYFFPYERDQLHDICSCTKSVSSTLIGIALEQGKIRSVKETLPELFRGRQWQNDGARKRRITLENLLTMSSGMNYPLLGEPRLAPMRAAPDMVQHILDLPMVAEPGAKFGYNSGGSHLLSAIITARTGQTAAEYARENLFAPLGIRRFAWPTDAQGNSFGWGDLRLTGPDMARIGYLFLHEGRWGERQVVSKRWVKEATRGRIAAEPEVRYGYQWWVRKDPARFEALGRGGQRITVLPQSDLVVVFQGGGFEPGDVGEFILKALRSDGPIPEDQAGYELLQAKVAAAASPPAAQSVPELPAATENISGKRYTLESNPLELTSIGFAFTGGDTAYVELGLEGQWELRPVGLDGVYRVSRQRPEEDPVALRGRWRAENEFEFVYNEPLSVQKITVRAGFEEDRLQLRLEDPWDDLYLNLKGRAEE